MVKALARAHRWKGMLESGDYASVAELAAAENIAQPHRCRVLRAIQDGRQPASLQLDWPLRPFPAEWDAQGEALLSRASD